MVKVDQGLDDSLPKASVFLGLVGIGLCSDKGIGEAG